MFANRAKRGLSSFYYRQFQIALKVLYLLTL